MLTAGIWKWFMFIFMKIVKIYSCIHSCHLLAIFIPFLLIMLSRLHIWGHVLRYKMLLTVKKKSQIMMSVPSVRKNHLNARCVPRTSKLDQSKTHERTHIGEMPFHCSNCEKTCSQAHNLRKHERTHTGEKPFKWSKCDPSFSIAGNLKEHEGTHTGEKPLKCNKCDKGISLHMEDPHRREAF